MIEAKPTETTLSPSQERELRGLALMLGDAGGFKLAIATFDSLADREMLIRRLSILLNKQGTTLSRLELTAGQPGASLLRSLKYHLQHMMTGFERHRAVAVTGMENLIALHHTPGTLRDDGIAMLAEANLQRDAFARDCPIPVVLWLSQTDTTVFAQEATDLWHWRSGTFDFSGEKRLRSSQGMIASDGRDTFTSYSSRDQLLERLKFLESQLAQLPEGHPVSDPRKLSQKARLLGELGRTHRELSDLSIAESCFQKQLSLAEMTGDIEVQIAAISNLADVFLYEARYAEAEPLMRRALVITEKSFGPEHPEVAVSLNNLAQLLKATNRLVEAEPLMRRALAIKEKSYDSEYSELAVELNNLAQLLKATNRLAEAEPLMRRALVIAEKSFGPEHPKIAIYINNLAQLLRDTNRLAEAEPLMRHALTIAEKSCGSEHPDVAVELNNFAQLLKATNRLVEAEPLMRRALAITEKSCGLEHPTVAICLNNLAQLLKATNRPTEAEVLMRRALAIVEKSFGPKHPQVAICLNNLALLLQDTNRLVESEMLMRRALAIDEKSYSPELPRKKIFY